MVNRTIAAKSDVKIAKRCGFERLNAARINIPEIFVWENKCVCDLKHL